ncbi:MAG: diguanylate cyclase domain-containing protein [Janthinobacterium lividum]
MIVRSKQASAEALVDAVPALLGYWDTDLVCRFANKTLLDWFGWPLAAVLGTHLRDLLGETVFTLNVPYIEGALAGARQRFERTILKADGQVLHALTHYVPDLDQDGIIAGFSVLVTDITELKITETRLALAASVFDSTIEGIMVSDHAGVTLAVNRAFSEITLYAVEDVVGQPDRIFLTDEICLPSVTREIAENGHWQRDAWGRRRDGVAFLASRTCTIVQNPGNAPLRYLTMFTDITELWRSTERIRYLALHDPLTELPNRSLLFDRLESLIRADRQAGSIIVMFLDLDRFKLVNDTYGHDMGDAVLTIVARRLQGVVPEPDMVARLGGDEFIIVMEKPSGGVVTETIAGRIIAAVNEPIEWDGRATQVGISIGVAEFPRDGHRPVDLLKNADEAMYRAKRAGRNCFRFANRPPIFRLT